MVDKIQLENGLELWQVKVDDLREQDVNARVMPDTMFRRLSETIKRDARLESLPFCALTSKGLEIVSGHHRVRAARSAGVRTIWAVVDTTGLTRSQIKAKQLAHNAISGSDDPSLLAQIFAEIEDVEDMQESFVSELGDVVKVDIGEIKVDLEPKVVYLMFVPLYYKKWQQLVATLPPAIEEVALADAAIESKFREALKMVGKSYNVKAITPLVCKMIDMVEEDENRTSQG